MSVDSLRTLALCGVIVLTASYVHPLGEVAAVVGTTALLYGVVAGTVVAATVLARTVGERSATAGAALVGAVCGTYYFAATGEGPGVVVSATGTVLADTLALATGVSILRVSEVGTWALAFVPAPVFLSWYLALRRRYGLAVLPGGGALVFLVLTGDATVGTTAVGVTGALAAVGFGELEVRGGTIAQADVLAVVFAAAIVLSTTVAVVPAGSSGPVMVADDGGTLEGSTTAAPDRAPIAGSVDLSPEVRFTVDSDRGSYWRTGVYDRFTGEEWIRTGGDRPYEDDLHRPPGSYDTISHTVALEGPADAMPVAPQPIGLEGEVADHTRVTAHGQPRPDGALGSGETYTVESAVVDASGADLEDAGTEYPEAISELYLETPADTSSEFEAYTAAVTDDAETPYGKAVAIEQYLRTSKGYSLEVDRPAGNVAEAFLLEMDEGYCVYFATAMTQMLRAADVPARYVVGYTSGQEVDSGEYVVRGTDAHAWVEVYFPDHGWVAFEPTPGESRQAAHDETVEDAREDGLEGVDTDESEDVPLDSNESGPIDGPGEPDAIDEEDENGTQPADPTDDRANETDPDDGNETPSIDSGDPAENDDGDDDRATTTGTDRDDGGWPDLETVALGVTLLVGIAAGARYTGLSARARRELAIQWQRGRGDPADDVARAYRRLEATLEREYRPREPTESSREYLEALSATEPLDPDAITVFRRYERAVYGEGVTRSQAEETVGIVDDFVRRRTPLVHRPGE